MRFLETYGFQYKDEEDLNKYIQNKKKEFIDFVVSNHSHNEEIKFIYNSAEYNGSLTSLAKQCKVSVSTVKKRYRSLDENLKLKNEYLLWVFGLAGNPKVVEGINIPKIFTQKKKINDYVLSDTVRFSRQVDFVKVVEKVLDDLGIQYNSMQKIISYYIPKDNKMSDIEKIEHLMSKLEKRFNVDNLSEKIINNHNNQK